MSNEIPAPPPVKITIETKLLRYMEKVFAAFMVFVVVWGLVMLIMSVNWGAPPGSEEAFHKSLEIILSDILLLVVGLELAMMLINRKIEYLIEIMLFVIARRMLLGTSGVMELGVGVAAMAALFAVRKYLIICPGCTLITSKKDFENVAVD